MASGQTEALNSALSGMKISVQAKAGISASVHVAIEQMPIH